VVGALYSGSLIVELAARSNGPARAAFRQSITAE